LQAALEVAKAHAALIGIGEALQVSIILNLDLQPAHTTRYAYCDVRQRAASFDNMAEAVFQQRLKSERGDAAVLGSGVDFPLNADAIGETLDHDVRIGAQQGQFISQ